MKATFEIEWPDDCGPGWMNVDSLEMCLRTKQFIGPKVELSVRDVTKPKLTIPGRKNQKQRLGEINAKRT